jgi:hypothetical protein
MDRVHNFGGPSKVSVQGIREIKSSATTRLGQVKTLALGKEVVYAKLSTAAGSAALEVGCIMQGPVLVANHQRNYVAITASIGEKEVILSLGATSAAKDLYADGTLLIECGTGTGYSYMIAGHPAWAASNSAAKVMLVDELELAMTTATLCSLIPNPYKGITTKPDSAVLTSHVCGVTLYSAALSDGGYCYLGKKGPWPVQAEGAWLIGNQLTVGSAAGSVGPNFVADSVAATNHTPIIGFAMTTPSTTGCGICNFNL